MAETVCKAHDRFPRFSQRICAAIVYAPGLLRIGGSAYLVWAGPPNVRCTAQRHVHVPRRTTVEYPTVADAMIET